MVSPLWANRCQCRKKNVSISQLERMQFDFGKNWESFSRKALTPERIEQARADFKSLMNGIELRERSFLDIGFGQGLSLLIAEESGAVVVGSDINPKCGELLLTNRKLFSDACRIPPPPIVIGSILNKSTVDALRAELPPQGVYDIVHAWGVLHHTGKMYRAIATASSLVGRGGYLVIALYNRHWTSPFWKLIKRIYCVSPSGIRNVWVALMYPVILIAKALVTRRNPFVMDRGMEFLHNVVDWVGGYPYEYLSIGELRDLMQSYSFDCIKVVPATVPTGCNEFVFQRKR